MGRRPKRQNEELACCILWSPLPVITWIIPFIGHMGLSDSQGVACDFQGPYYVCEDGNMMVGAPTRYLHMPLHSLVLLSDENNADDESGVSTQQKHQLWDRGLREANEIYKKRMHNICCDNCHSHVACALNCMGLEAHGIGKWDMVKLCLLIFLKGRFVSVGSFVRQFGPFLFLLFIFTLFGSVVG